LLLLAGSSPVAEWARWSAAGVSDFLMKPVHPQELALKTLSLVYRAATGGK
jgi:PleD family two-component response regulator